MLTIKDARALRNYIVDRYPEGSPIRNLSRAYMRAIQNLKDDYARLCYGSVDEKAFENIILRKCNYHGNAFEQRLCTIARDVEKAQAYINAESGEAADCLS